MKYLYLLALLGTSLVLSAHRSDVHNEGVIVEELQKTSSMWNGEPLPAYPQGRPEITILRITIPPHTELPWHTHPVINSGVLLSGRLVVTAQDGKTMELVPGQALCELVDRPHYGRNPDDAPAVIIVFYAGIEGEPITLPFDQDKMP